MKKFSPFQIIKHQDLELIFILENYSNYTNPTILYSYAEFTRRKLIQNELIIINIEEFEKKYLEFDNYDINSSIKGWCQKEGAESYDELYLTFIGQIKIKVNEKVTSEPKRREINAEYIVSAGRSLKSIVVVAIIMAICSVIGFILAYNTKDIESIHVIYYTTGTIGLIAWFIILLKIYSAGSNLEDAVIYR